MTNADVAEWVFQGMWLVATFLFHLVPIFFVVGFTARTIRRFAGGSRNG